jgi:hypothetical protein
MNWNNLKNNKCPKCNSEMYHRNHAHVCVSDDCDFTCSTEKFEEIVDSLYNGTNSYGHSAEDNLSELNNM